VRPFAIDIGITQVNTELKLLQIDLVFYLYFNFNNFVSHQ